MRFVRASVFLLCLILSGQQTSRKGIDSADIDPTCKPCTDFWRFANGGWLDKNPIPAGLSAWGPGLAQEHENWDRLRVILEAAAANKSASAVSNERKIGDFYASCMDTTAIAARDMKVLDPEFDRISAIHSVKELTDALTEFQLNGFSQGDVGPVSLWPSQNVKDSKDVVAGVFADGPSLPDRDYYFSSNSESMEIREQFLRHVARMFELSGEKPEAAVAAAKTVLAFETPMAEAVMTREQLRDPKARYHLMNLDELSALTPSYDWKPIFRQSHIAESTLINVGQPEFVRRFNRQLTAAPLEDWRTWLRWRVLNLAAPYLPKPFVDKDFFFNQTILLGVKEQKPRWQSCTEAVNDNMTDALGEAFVRKHFPPEAKRRMEDLVEHIRATLRDELARAEWLTPETRRKAISKIDAFRAKIGYPDKWRDYSGLNIDRESYFQNLRAAWAHDRMYEMAKIGRPVDRNEWLMPPQSVNAYSAFERNEIVFTAGILLPPIFDLNADDVVNYATIGALVGHEMSHHFDDQGSKFDADGNLKDWWTAEDRKRFGERTACVVDQFDRLDVGDGLHHRGRLVVGEALADLGSVSLAYRAYKRSLIGKPQPPMIDGFTIDQQFFLAFAHKFSTEVRPEAVRLWLRTNPHPLPRFRAIGTLQNVPEFQEAFQCKRGDFMFRPPEAQCRLW